MGERGRKVEARGKGKKEAKGKGKKEAKVKATRKSAMERGGAERRNERKSGGMEKEEGKSGREKWKRRSGAMINRSPEPHACCGGCSGER